MEVTVTDITKLIVLRKRKAEAEFKIKVLNADCQKELDRMNNNAKELEAKLRSCNIEIIYPNQDKLENLSNQLNEHTHPQIKEAIMAKEGQIYETLIEKGEIVKENFINRLEIAKVVLMIAKTGESEQKMITTAVRAGKLNEPMIIDSLSEINRKNLARFLNRCGIHCRLTDNQLAPDNGNDEETRVELRTRHVWVNQEIKEKLELNLKRITEITPPIQLKNAQRHVKIFSDEEENEFNSLQKEYLELLKEQDGLLTEFDGEEKLSVKV
ncbi:hypothetical protein KKF81_02355 [Candidatus Micrarchaeota archaeon]|nr:hypothetical protein [Candidatus Micrarchaeota archaeon]